MLYAPGGGRVDLDEPGGTALAYQAVLAEGVEVKSRFGQWPTVLRDTTEIEASANPPAPELDEQLRGIAERMQAGYPTPATDATQCGPRVKPPSVTRITAQVIRTISRPAERPGSSRSISIAPLHEAWRCREEDSASVARFSQLVVSLQSVEDGSIRLSALEMWPYWLALERA